MTSTSWDRSERRAAARSPGAWRRGHARHASGGRKPTSALQPPTELREAGLSARKALGQHFLIDPDILEKIAEAADLTGGETVVEVGAGLGGLTSELSVRAGRVIAIELDDGLASYLEGRFAETNVTVVHGDALELTPAETLTLAQAAPPYVVVGNLPYNIAQPLLRHLLEARPAPEWLVVMIQAEVAESIVAAPGKMSLQSLSVQLYGEPSLLFYVPPSAFYPPPKVRSAVVRIDMSPRLRAAVEDIEAFFRVARAGFGQRRKQLHNALSRRLAIEPQTAGDLLADAGIDPKLRAQALSLDQWAALTTAWIERGRPEDTT